MARLTPNWLNIREQGDSVDSLLLTIRSERPRSAFVVEQGIPVLPMAPEDMDGLRLLDENGRVMPASIEEDGRDEQGGIVWLRLAAAVDAKPGVESRLSLESRPDLPSCAGEVIIEKQDGAIDLETPFYRIELLDPGSIRLRSARGDVLVGEVRFQLWPDARSIVGGGAGTCRLAGFIPKGWSVEEQTPSRCLILLRGRVPKFAAYTGDPEGVDSELQFDCELELVCYAFSPVIRLRWRMDNYTNWQASLERYALVLPLPRDAAVEDGERSDDGKFLRYVRAATPGGSLTLAAKFVHALGAGAGISVERRRNLGELSPDEVARFAGGGVFEPHRYLAAEQDDGCGLDLVVGGINPPQDGRMTAENPEVHRLFYLGMGRTFEGALLTNCSEDQLAAELEPVCFELDPAHYSRTGALPENGDPVSFEEFKGAVAASAEWLLRKQWRGTLWWGEWWREYDVYRKQGVESTSNGNNPLGPLYHYWRTGDARFVECAKRSMEFNRDVQLSKRRGGLGSFFHSRRYLMDQMEWIHMRYQRIEGTIKASHFFGDRRVRRLVTDAMGTFADKLVWPNGAPGYGRNGRRAHAGSDCVNFAEALVICWRETGEGRFLEMAKRMGRWTLREFARLEGEGYVGNSNHFRYVLRGMLAVIRATGDKRVRQWYIERARKNMTGMPDFVMAMAWLVTEAEKMSGETWLLDALYERVKEYIARLRPDGGVTNSVIYPWSKWPSTWDRLYDAQHIVSYLPVLAARRAALAANRL